MGYYFKDSVSWRDGSSVAFTWVHSWAEFSCKLSGLESLIWPFSRISQLCLAVTWAAHFFHMATHTPVVSTSFLTRHSQDSIPGEQRQKPKLHSARELPEHRIYIPLVKTSFRASLRWLWNRLPQLVRGTTNDSWPYLIYLIIIFLISYSDLWK